MQIRRIWKKQLNIFMLIASYTDIKSMKIYNKFNIVMLITRIVSIIAMLLLKEMTMLDALGYLGGAVIMFLAFLIPAMITLDSIGGDIKFAFNVGFWIGLRAALLVSCIASITNFLFRILFVGQKDKEPYFGIFMNVPVKIMAKKILPLGPFFYLGYIVLFIIKLIMFP